MNIRQILTLIVALGASIPSAWAQERFNDFPRDLHGLWFEPGDPGWATAMFDHTAAMSTVLMFYDIQGRASWATSPRLDCHREVPPWLSVECNGPLYRVTGSWFGSPTFRASDVTVRQVGEWRGQFTTPLFGGVGPNVERRLDLQFNVETWGIAPHGQKPLKIQKIDPTWREFLWQDGRYSGLWGNRSENGWGIGIFVQNNVLNATLFVHGPDLQPRWYVILANDAFIYENRPDRIFEGKVYETRGYPRESNLAGSSSVRQVGTASLHFGAEPGSTAELRYSIDGVQVSKTIRRQD